VIPENVFVNPGKRQQRKKTQQKDVHDFLAAAI
jgi:hypothetical protein